MNAESFPNDIRGYHLRTKHAPHRYALGPAFLDWTSQPSPYRRFLGARLVRLPLGPDPRTRFPGPAPEARPIDRDSLGAFFELAFGLSAWKSVEGSSWAVRNNPSSGNLHPTEAYALLDPGAGLGDAPGLYHYAPLEHALEERASFRGPSLLPPGGFLVGFTHIPWREAWKYGERAFRYCQLDAGHAIGAAAMAGAALGWRVHVLAPPSDAEIASLLGLDRPDASHRREEEHPDLLLWAATNDAPPPALDLARLAASDRRFFGCANRLSEDHDAWPVVELALRYCRKGASAPLPPPEPSPSPRTDRPIVEVVRQRRSAQRMDGVSSLSLASFRLMLAATLPGAEPLLSPFCFPPRLSLLLYAHRVDGLDPGLYLLERDAEIVSRLRLAAFRDFDWSPVDLAGLRLWRLRLGPVEREATRLSCLQPIAGKGCFAVAMIADFDRTLSQEGAFAYRRLHWEAGLIGQALYLWATAFGLSGTGIGCFFDDEVHALLGLEGTQFQDLYHFTVGGAVEDSRILTLPPYPQERC